MKKCLRLLSATLSIIILLASLGISGFSASAQITNPSKVLPWGESYVIEDFGLSYDVTLENGPFSAYGGVTRENFAVENGALKGTYPAGSGENGYTWASKIDTPAKDDMAISVDINAEAVTVDFRIRALLAVSGLGYIQPGNGAIVYFVAEDGTVDTTTVDKDSTVVIPAGFKGTLAIGFNAFFKGNNDKLNNQKLYELSNINFQIRVFDVAEDDTVISFDNIAFLNNSVLPENSRLIKDLGTITTGNLSVWRDGTAEGTDDTFTSANDITISDTNLTANYPAKDGNRCHLYFKLWDTGVFAATDKAVSVDIDASSLDYSLKMQIRITNEGKKDSNNADIYSYLPVGAPVYFVAEDGTVYRDSMVTFSNSEKGAFVNIPSQFKGKLLFSLDDLVKNSDIQDDVYSYTSVSIGCIAIDSKVESNVIYDNICYYSESITLPWDMSYTVSDFASFTNAPSAWGTSSAYKPTISTEDEKLSVSYVAVSGNEMTWELKLGTSGVLKANDTAFGIDVDASALTYSPKLQLQLRSSSAYYRTATGATAYFVDSNGKVATAEFVTYGGKGAYVEIPVGFKGTVVVAISDFSDTNAAEGATVYDIADMVFRALIIDTNEASTIFYDNIKYYFSLENALFDNMAELWADTENRTAVLENGIAIGNNENAVVLNNLPEFLIGKEFIFNTLNTVTLPWESSKVISDFTSFTNAPTGWRAGSGETFNTANNLVTDGEKLIVTYPSVSGNEMTWELKLGASSVFAENDKAFAMDIDASALSYSPMLQVRLVDETDSNKAHKRAAVDSVVYFVASDGNVSTGTVVDYGNSKGGYVEIPVGFKGTVVYALDTLTDGTYANTVYDLTNVTVRTLIIDTDEASTISYDNIRYYYEEEITEDTNTLKATVATKAGLVYALALDGVVPEGWEEVAADYTAGCDYALICKTAVTGEAFDLENAVIICENAVVFNGTDCPIYFGDCNSDSKVNVIDLVRIKKYEAGADVTIWEAAADVDLADGIDTVDMALIRQHLIDSSVKLGY